jgi:hypothetical protein
MRYLARKTIHQKNNAFSQCARRRNIIVEDFVRFGLGEHVFYSLNNLVLERHFKKSVDGLPIACGRLERQQFFESGVGELCIAVTVVTAKYKSHALKPETDPAYREATRVFPGLFWPADPKET